LGSFCGIPIGLHESAPEGEWVKSMYYGYGGPPQLVTADVDLGVRFVKRVIGIDESEI